MANTRLMFYQSERFSLFGYYLLRSVVPISFVFWFDFVEPAPPVGKHLYNRVPAKVSTKVSGDSTQSCCKYLFLSVEPMLENVMEIKGCFFSPIHQFLSNFKSQRKTKSCQQHYTDRHLSKGAT